MQQAILSQIQHIFLFMQISEYMNVNNPCYMMYLTTSMWTFILILLTVKYIAQLNKHTISWNFISCKYKKKIRIVDFFPILYIWCTVENLKNAYFVILITVILIWGLWFISLYFQIALFLLHFISCRYVSFSILFFIFRNLLIKELLNITKPLNEFQEVFFFFFI